MEKIVVDHVAWIESLSKETVSMDALKKVYSSDVHYHDPFHDVVGIDSIHKIYNGMFEQFDEVEIKVTGQAVNGTMAFVSWKMSVKAKKKQGDIEGTTRLRFDENGLIRESLDFYDASIFFEAIPVLGCLMRWIRKHAG